VFKIFWYVIVPCFVIFLQIQFEMVEKDIQKPLAKLNKQCLVGTLAQPVSIEIDSSDPQETQLLHMERNYSDGITILDQNVNPKGILRQKKLEFSLQKYLIWGKGLKYL